MIVAENPSEKKEMVAENPQIILSRFERPVLGDVLSDGRKSSLTLGRNPFVESLTTDSEHVCHRFNVNEFFLFLIIRRLFLSFSLCGLFKNMCIKSEALRSFLSACVRIVQKFRFGSCEIKFFK